MFEFSSIEDYHSRLQQGSITCEQAVEYYLSRISDYARLNAYIRVYGEEALARARQLDAQRRNGAPMRRLHGVIAGIKDLICYKDHPVSAASKALHNFVSTFSATTVDRLLSEEAIIIGHHNCDEFGMGSTNEHSWYGKVLNPVDETLVPGGSSGGSAAAQAAGLCMIALGSDTGGSVRQPADFCGTIGFKPGYGRISRHGLIAYASSFDHIGIFSNNVKDAELVLECLSGPDDFDSTAVPQPYIHAQEPENKNYRIAYFPSALDHPSLDADIRQSISHTLDQLAKAGNPVTAVDFEWLDYLVPAYYILTTAEASANLSRYDGLRFGFRAEQDAGSPAEFYRKNRSEGFGAEVRRRILLGSFVLSAGYYDAYFTKAQKVRRLVKEKLNEIFNSHDVIILPNSPVRAFPIGEKMSDPVTMYLADLYTVMANLAGIPAISLPLYRPPEGPGFGIQVMSNEQNEVILLGFSEKLMHSFSGG